MWYYVALILFIAIIGYALFLNATIKKGKRAEDELFKDLVMDKTIEDNLKSVADLNDLADKLAKEHFEIEKMCRRKLPVRIHPNRIHKRDLEELTELIQIKLKKLRYG